MLEYRHEDWFMPIRTKTEVEVARFDGQKRKGLGIRRVVDCAGPKVVAAMNLKRGLVLGEITGTVLEDEAYRELMAGNNNRQFLGIDYMQKWSNLV